jgi:hexosaminidase
MQSRPRCLFSFLLVATLVAIATHATAAGPEPAALIPRPAKVEWQKGEVEIRTQIGYADPAAKDEAEMLATILPENVDANWPAVQPATSFGANPANAVVLGIDPGLEKSLGKEGYQLEVLPAPLVRITAATPAGLFYGGQTLRQLLLRGKVGAKNNPGPVNWEFPCCKIEDKPRFLWRGLLLDEGRHFFGEEFVKHYIDLLAAHKLNTLHWHLTEDQGWRIEIKKYPKLTEIGSWREQTDGDGKRYGGFYTQDQIREVVAYAARRHVTIVPEIEMPGHSLGALTAYPQFSCTGGPFKVRTRWGVEEDVYCAGNDATFAFLNDVLDEVTGLFPSTFIHIGGDECPKARWKNCPKCQARIKAEGLKNEHELQSYFIRRIEDHLASKGRRLIGWDEILEGGLPPKATVMSWRGMGGATAAAESGHDYVATPTSHCYLDYPATSISLEKAYSFEPIPATLAAAQRAHCLGLQGNMWTEHTPGPAAVDRMVWPRLCALAEVAWTPKDLRDGSDFLARMETHAERLKSLGVEVHMPGKQVGTWKAAQMSEDYKRLEWDVTRFLTGPGAYEFEFAYSKGKCGAAIRWAALTADGVEADRDGHEGFAGARSRQNTFTLRLPSHNTAATYKLEASMRSDGGTDSNGVVRVKPAASQR